MPAIAAYHAPIQQKRAMAWRQNKVTGAPGGGTHPFPRPINTSESQLLALPYQADFEIG